jgi:hypothetical protein
MTAINIILKQKSVSIASDTAWYGADGRIAHFASKTRPLNGMNAIIAWRGALFVFDQMEEALEVLGSVDAILAHGGEVIRRELEQCADAQFEIYLAGWSESLDRPVAKVLVPTAMHGLAPLEWHELPEALTVAPLPARSAVTSVGMRRPPADLETLDVERFGRQLLEAQRLTKFPLTDGGIGLHLVGGTAELYAVSAEGLQESTLVEWDDTLGSHIQPFGKRQPLISTVIDPGMNRQQRRAAEREAAKQTTSRRKAA